MPFISTAGKRTNRKDDVVLGAAKFERSLHGIDDSVYKNVLRSATRGAVKPILKNMRNQVKPISKTMAKALGNKVKIYKRSKTAIGLIGIRNTPSVRKPYSDPKNRNRGKGASKGIHDPRFTFHLVDLGTKAHAIKKAFGKKGLIVRHPGTMAQQVRDKALKETDNAVIAGYEAAFTKAVNRELAKL